ncbi:MAG: glycine cleavage system protein T [Deltaproteobacteria bacterium]|nr:MAG: glycine cleavage system protein T [Deltaproteobacteria bacterium]
MALKTRLNEFHHAMGANMAEFGGYEMPLWYNTGAREEHLIVLRAAGLFDTSHMAMIEISGKGAFELLQKSFSKDLLSCIGPSQSPLADGRCVYGVFLNEKGHVIDDAIVYRFGDEFYSIVVNAGMGKDICAHLENHKKGLEAEIKDLTDKIGKLDVQGPLSGLVLKAVLNNSEDIFSSFVYFSHKGHFDKSRTISSMATLKEGNIPILLSRTGYTGEFGFEIFTDADNFVKVWNIIYEAGKIFELTPCGLAARDSLRSGACLPLSHQDIGDWVYVNHPWDFTLPYENMDKKSFTKEFTGSRAVLESDYKYYTYPFVGSDLRKVNTEDAVVVDENDNEIGRVLTCATDVGTGWVDGKLFSISSPRESGKPACFKPKGVRCGFVHVRKELKNGDKVFLKSKKRKLDAIITGDIRPHRTARKKITSMP